MNPFLTVVNKSPFYVSYYMTLMHYTRILYFEYVNEDSVLQFITYGFRFQRDFYTDPYALLDCAFVMKDGVVYETEICEDLK